MFRQELASNLINILIQDIGLKQLDVNFINKTGSVWDKELGFLNYEDLAEGLKKITFQCINHNNDVFLYERMGDEILQFLAEKCRSDSMLLPPEYRAGYLQKAYPDSFSVKDETILQERLICDYISGMMDSYAISLYKKLNKMQRGDYSYYE